MNKRFFLKKNDKKKLKGENQTIFIIHQIWLELKKIEGKKTKRRKYWREKAGKDFF